MAEEPVVMVDMDQEVEVRIRINIGTRYGSGDLIGYTVTAPLFIAKDMSITSVATTLFRRAMSNFFSTLREKALRETRANQACIARMEEEARQERPPPDPLVKRDESEETENTP